MPQARWKISFQMPTIPNVGNSMPQILSLTANAAREEWIKLARQKLRSSASAYISSIGPVELGRNQAVIRLRKDTPEGRFANAIEQGTGPYDLKKGLLKGPKAKQTIDGKPYTHVPFQLKTPGSGVSGPSPPVMPRSIYRMASQMGIGQQMKLPQKYEDYGIKTRLSADVSKWGHYTWKTSPYQGIIRTQTVRGQPVAGGKSAYVTIRTVSKKSDPASWIHPGFRAKNLIEEASNKLEQIFPEVLEAMSRKGVI